MSLENASWGAGGGIFGGAIAAILSAMGLKDRIQRLEKEKLDEKVFNKFEEGLDKRLSNIEHMLERIINEK